MKEWLRLIFRFHHNLIVSSCCNNGVPIQEEVFREKACDTADSEDEIYYDTDYQTQSSSQNQA